MAINRKKNILLVGSDSGIVQELIKKIIYKGDNLTTVSRKKKPGFHSSHHYQVDLSDEKQVERFCSKKISIPYFLNKFILSLSRQINSFS